MFYSTLIVITAFIFFFFLVISIGHSILRLKIRKEENKRLEIVSTILDRYSQIIKESKEISNNIEDYMYSANVRQEIDKIIGRNESN